MKKSILIFFITLFCKTASAQLIVGSYIGYKAIDSVTYEVYLTLYRDCNGGAINSPTIKVTGKSSGTYTASTTLQSVRDITGSFSGCTTQTKCNSGTYALGFQELVYNATVDVSSGACRYYFEYDTGSRPSYITNGAASTPLSNNVWIDKCLGANTSAVYSLPPQFILPTGQDYFYNHGFYDNADSLSYNLVAPLGAAASNWQKPVTFLGFPNASLPFPSGFRLDSVNGSFMFRPTKNNEISSYCIQITEWRKSGNSRIVVGQTRLEGTFFVMLDSVNKMPKLSGNNAIACVGKQRCITLTSSDTDTSDSTFISFAKLLPGTTTTITYNGKNAVAEVCWTPQASDLDKTNFIIASVRDNSCPKNGTTTKDFIFTARETPDSSHFGFGTKTVLCNTVKIKLLVKKSFPQLAYSLQPIDSVLSWQFNADTLSIAFADTGWNKFAVIARTNAPCASDPFIDSVYIPATSYKFQIAATNDTALCVGDSIHLFATPLNGITPFTYSWSLNGAVLSNSASLYNRPITTTNYKVTVTDNYQCVAVKNTTTVVNNIPVVWAGIDSLLCPKTSFTLEATIVTPSKTPYLFIWNGTDTGQTLTRSLNNSKWFHVIAKDSNGCSSLADSVYYTVYPFKLTNFPDTTICYGTSVKMSATATNFKNPLKYEWIGTSNISSTITAANLTQDSLFVLKAKDGNGCELYDSIQVTALPKLLINATADTSICKGDDITLKVTGHNGVLPVSYLWDTTYTTDTLRVTVNATQAHYLKITDAFGCVGFDTITVAANPNPLPNAGADSIVCKGTTLTFKANNSVGAAPFNYLWDNAHAADTFSTLVSSQKSYVVKCTDSNNCVGFDTVAVNVHPTSKATFTPLPQLCQNDTQQTLQALPIGGTWLGNGVSGNVFSPRLAGAGIHILAYSFTDTFGCISADTTTALVDTVLVPSFTVDIDTGIVPFAINLTNTTPPPANTWQWEVRNEFDTVTHTSTNKNPSFTITTAGKYSIRLTAGDGKCYGETTVNNAVIGQLKVGINADENPFIIYPNPAATKVFVKGREINSISLYDIHGRVILIDTEQKGTEYTVNLPDIEPGVYLLHLKYTNKKSFVYKLIIANQ
ncbi:MAG: T9SS type A sorting domain-containing protein [Bacteroidota bacterium]